jgi:hypothetical protein
MQYWHWIFGAKKTDESRRSLVDMLRSPHFDPDELSNTNWKALDEALSQTQIGANKRLKRHDMPDSHYHAGGWTERNVEIPIPFKDRKTFDPHRLGGNPNLNPDNIFTAPPLHYRSVAKLIQKVAEEESSSRNWIWDAHTKFWKMSEEGVT